MIISYATNEQEQEEKEVRLQDCAEQLNFL